VRRRATEAATHAVQVLATRATGLAGYMSGRPSWNIHKGHNIWMGCDRHRLAASCAYSRHPYQSLMETCLDEQLNWTVSLAAMRGCRVSSRTQAVCLTLRQDAWQQRNAEKSEMLYFTDEVGSLNKTEWLQPSCWIARKWIKLGGTIFGVGKISGHSPGHIPRKYSSHNFFSLFTWCRTFCFHHHHLPIRQTTI